MNIKVVGHQGYKGRYPHNTLIALREAASLGVDFLEIDLQLTGDNHLVLLHDEVFESCSDGSGRAADLTLDEIRTFDAGVKFDYRFKGEKVPTVQEAFQSVKGKPVHFCLEFKINKWDDPEIVASRALNVIHEERMGRLVVVNSFNSEFLQIMKKKDPKIRILPEVQIEHFSDPLEAVSWATSLDADGVECPWEALTEELIYEFQRRCLQVWAWTVNEPVDISRMIDKGVDAILSDFPERVIERL